MGHTINIGHGKGVTIADLVEKLMDLTSISKPIVTDEQRVRPKDSEVFELICDNSLAKELMEWEPQVSLNDGLNECVEFVTDNLNLFKIGKYEV